MRASVRAIASRRWSAVPSRDHLAIHVEGGSIDAPVAGLQRARQTVDFRAKPFVVAGCFKRFAATLPRHQCRRLSSEGDGAKSLELVVGVQCTCVLLLRTLHAG